tara:strand:+ start:164 stop:592 length:429 start_codon:yes stop_codon:yes gene_type:complete
MRKYEYKNLKLDNENYWYRISKNKNGHLVRQKVFKKSKDALYKSTDMSATNNMISDFNLDDIMTKKLMKEKLSAALTHLNPKEERVLRMRYGIGLNTDYTLEEVGQVLSVTRDRICQIEAKAMRKLKHPKFKELLTLTKEAA